MRNDPRTTTMTNLAHRRTWFFQTHVQCGHADPAHDAKALRAKFYRCLVLAGMLVCSAVVFSSGGWTDAIAQETVRFAVIGDYGFVGDPEADVADLVISWAPDFIITTGDNNYDFGEASTIDINIGQFYHDYISPYFGSFGAGSPSGNRFFPSLGNHDWDSPNAQPYLDYFALPGNERYYTFRRGPVHFFVLDSDPREPDGVTSDSAQAQWLRDGLQASTSPWRLVYFHHPPYSSGSTHGSQSYMQWPFQVWGASAVLTGHEHNYERLILNNFPYFVVGSGGRSLYDDLDAPISGSVVRYSDDYGAMLVDATSSAITFRFYYRFGALVDSYTATGGGVTLTVTKAGTGSGTVTSTPAGINCGSTCSAAFAQGTSVTLTASATSGSTFTGWSGAGCSGTGTCLVSMTQARNVTATFTGTGGTTLSVSPTTVAPGGTITATWSGIAAPSATDWIGLYTPGAANTAYIHWIYVSCSQSAGAARASGSCPFVAPSTVAPGTYQLRLLANDGFTLLATSSNFTVQ
jgi:tartrate-resistant acid phosphatase type 5